MTKQEFLAMNDHSLLKPQLTKDEIMEGLQYAKESHCASVCINPCNLDMAREVLKGSDVDICTVIGFPSGAHTTFSKVAEAVDAYARGAVELDMVIDIGALKNGEYEDVYNDIKAVVDATPAIVMRASVSEKVHVKAAGGVSTRADVEAMAAAGADRVGVSRTKAIAAEF